MIVILSKYYYLNSTFVYCYDNNNNKTCEIVDFAILVDH